MPRRNGWRGNGSRNEGHSGVKLTETASPAVAYLARYHEARNAVRAQWKEDAGELLDAHQFALSAIVSMVDRVADIEFEQQSKPVEGRMSLTAQVVQGIDVCETAISEGLYSQAAALLKQEMETIEAVHEYETGQRRDRKTPKLNLLRNFGRAYGEFNSYAHVSVEDINKSIVHFQEKDVSGPTVIPQYRREIAEYFYGLHVFFVVCCGTQMKQILSDVYDLDLAEQKLLWLGFALRILQDRDIIRPENEDSDDADTSQAPKCR